MSALKSFLATAIGVLLLLSAFPAAAAVQGDSDVLQFSEGPMEYFAEDSRLLVENGNVTVWFQDYRPVVHIFTLADNGTKIGFTVGVKGVFEVDGSNVPVAVLPLNRPYPVSDMVSDGQFNYTSGVLVTYQESTQTVDVAFNITANEFLSGSNMLTCDQTPALDGSGRTADVVGPASVSIVFHISVNTGFVKFDLIVNEWTWVNESGDMLSLAMVIDGHYVTCASGQRPSYDGTLVGENRGNDTQLRYTIHNTYYYDSVIIKSTELIDLGYITWAGSATAGYDNGTYTTAAVSTYLYNCSNEDSAAAMLLFVFEVPEGWNTAYSTLYYDPVIGLGPLVSFTQSQDIPEPTGPGGGTGTAVFLWPHPDAAAIALALVAAAAALSVIVLLGVLLLRRE